MPQFVPICSDLLRFLPICSELLSEQISEAWGPPQFQEKRSRSEKAILGALGEFRGILGAALGIGNSILGIRNSILGMASHDLINTKPTILGATLGAIPGIAANPPERFSFAPAFSERFFKNWGGPRAQENQNESGKPLSADPFYKSPIFFQGPRRHSAEPRHRYEVAER